MDWLTIIKVAIYLIMCAILSVPTLIAFFKTRSTRRKAADKLAEAVSEKEKAEAEAAKERADAELYKYAEQLIVGEEIALNGLDKLMKMQSDTAGSMKKDLAFIKLQAYALQKNFEFDIEKWSQTLDDLVAFTKNVNVKR